MNAVWRRYTAWFDARNRRERTVIGLAVLGVILLLGLEHLVLPVFDRLRVIAAETRLNRLAIAETASQIVQLERRVADPDAAARAQLEQLRSSLAAQEPALRQLQATLVSAEQMPQFLRGLLARSHALQLVSLKTLPPVAVDQAAAAPSLYKHGVEIAISGGYADLSAYVAALEQAPQKMLWERLELQSGEYPRSTMTLTVYTLSLDKTWLVI